jgi:hypothetical protein
MDGHVTLLGGGIQKCIKMFGGKTCRKGTTERSRRRWEESIKIDAKKQGGKAWTRLLCLRVLTSGELL